MNCTRILCVLLIKTPRARNIISAYDVKVSAYNEVVSECSDKAQRTSAFAILARNVEVSAEKENEYHHKMNFHPLKAVETFHSF